MRRKIVAGNWKMNGDIEFARKFASDLSARLNGVDLACSVLIAPQAPLISILEERFANTVVELAAQNVSSFDSGAYTGEVSAELLKSLGCSYSLVGHSERRTLFGEDDQVVKEKISRLIEQGIVPILCVGETLQEREAGKAEDVVSHQVQQATASLSNAELSKVIVAYEPVWAIGTGLTATPQQAQQMHAHIRSVLSSVDAECAEKITILYGGSVNSKTADELFAQPDIDGGLVGGASLKVDEFLTICQAF